MHMCWYLFLLVGAAASQGKDQSSAPGCADVNGQSGATNSSTLSTGIPEKTPSSTSTTKPTSTPSTTTTQSTTTTPSTTTTQGTPQGSDAKYAVYVNREGCLRKVLKSYGSLYPASCVVRCQFYDKIMRDGRPCLKVIENQLEERQSVKNFMCWKGYCRYGVCVTKRFSQKCEVPANRTFTRRPNRFAE
uniref:Evasin n=1 Tax=Rhipicephalus zambeziensis TaxID=60191 RepID=A0A224YCT9_9ACAR